jgi:mono/diheme cytochrome c family protein
MRDLDIRPRADGTLDLATLGPLLPDAAKLWIADYLKLYEDGRPLSASGTVRTQLSVPSDRSFTSYDAAVAHVTGVPLPASTELRWTQAMLDVIIEYPITNDQAHFTIEPGLAHLGVRTTTVLRFLPPGSGERVFEYIGNPGLVALDPRWYEAARRFVVLGIGHILSGIDHLLFVLCLVIPVRRWRRLLEIITAFTVAHSITLVGSALGVAPSALWFPPLIEVLIALSIVYMALENIVVPAERLGYRWRMAFAFGLVHGFGFSFALKESLQFGGAHLVASLAAFNVGVEIGQLAVLAAAVPLLAWLLPKLVSERTGVVVLSAIVAHQAWHWMTERGAALLEYRFTAPEIDTAFWLALVQGGLLLCVALGAAWGFQLIIRRFGSPRSRVVTSLMISLMIGLVVALGASPTVAHAQRTTHDGIFTAEQAAQGRDLYLGLCQSCHTAISHTGAPFKEHWVGKPLSDLMTYILTLMPKSAPGTLEPDDAAMLLAYILKLNGMPAGGTTLSAEISQLRQIKIELKTAAPKLL